MNKNVLAIAGAIAVIGVVVYFAVASKTDETTDTQQTQTENTNQESNNQTPTSQKNSLKGLLASGSQKCTYGDSQNQGTVYTSNGKARMDMSTVANGVTTSMHAIIDGETYYSWVEGQPSGFKFSIAGSGTGSAGSNQNVDVNQQYDYNCSNWSEDGSLFTLPGDVTFMDMSAYQKPPGN